MVDIIQGIGPDQFSLYGAIPNWYRVESVLRVEVMDGGLGGFRLVEERVAEPYVRDYDIHHDDDPAAWAATFDTSHWGMFVASDGEQAVGGATVALDSPVYPMDHFQRQDLAVLWDIRVHPGQKGRGIGAKLFQYAADWARGKGYGQLGVETDSANVPACRFYLRQGCTLGAIHRFGYIACPEVTHNAMLLWYFDLSPERNRQLPESINSAYEGEDDSTEFSRLGKMRHRQALAPGSHCLNAVLGVSERFGWGLTLAAHGEGLRWLPAEFG